MSDPGDPSVARPLRPLVRIHYRRPPDRIQIFEQMLLYEDEDVRITFEPSLPLPSPKWIGGNLAMEPQSPVLWFTYPDTWHDIGLFHSADGRYTGLYANILTPPRFQDRLTWHTTDLYLDLWIPAGSTEVEVLDREQFETARARGLLQREEAAGAEAEVKRILGEAEAGRWPPPVVAEWDLSRAHALAGSADGSRHGEHTESPTEA